jgi:hypothetical protein
MASQTLRPHRSPSPGPAPSTPTMPGQPAKLTRQSLGPPTAASGAPKGFGNLGISSPTTSQPRHASSGVMPGNHRESLGARPSLGGGNRGASGGRPSSEFLPGARDARSRTPESKLFPSAFYEHKLIISGADRPVVQAPCQLGADSRRDGCCFDRSKLYRRTWCHRAM